MSTSFFIEDIFINFAKEVFTSTEVELRDSEAVDSFYFTIIQGSQLTRLQGEFVLRLLKKYKSIVESINPAYVPAVESPSWKAPFRILDTTKTAKVIVGENNVIEIRLKFPYAFKAEFEKLFGKSAEWDHAAKENKISLYDINLVALYEFLVNNSFNIDNSVLDVMATIEEVWQNQDSIEPYAVVEDSKVQLKNAASDAQEYWNEHQYNDLNQDLILAHQMNFRLKLDSAPASIYEKIAAEENSSFWVKEFDTFFDLHKVSNGASVIILDRSDNIIEWLDKFVDAADRTGVPRNDIKLCFRDDKSEGTVINDWIKQHNVGGKIEGGKIFVFRHKPAKWLFSGQIPVKIIGTNSLFPMTNLATQKWLEAHNCVLYIGDVKASQIKGKNIVEL